MSTGHPPAMRDGRPLDIHRIDPQPAGALVARAMNDNPTHRAVFGAHALPRQQRLQAFLDVMLPWVATHGVLLGASLNGRLVGVLGLLPPGRCQPRGRQRLSLGIALLRRQNPWHALRLLRWLHAWHRADPAAPHWHLGPLAVTPECQRLGVGTALLTRGLARVDASAAPAYLETDLLRNVVLYQRLGFDVAARGAVLGVPNWFMWRQAAPQDVRPPSSCN